MGGSDSPCMRPWLTRYPACLLIPLRKTLLGGSRWRSHCRGARAPRDCPANLTHVATQAQQQHGRWHGPDCKLAQTGRIERPLAPCETTGWYCENSTVAASSCTSMTRRTCRTNVFTTWSPAMSACLLWARCVTG